MTRPKTSASAIRRRLLTGMLCGAASIGAPRLAKANGRKRILMITYRGLTDAESGFRHYLAASGFTGEILYRDLNQNISRLPAVLDEIDRLSPDLIYTWGTPITLGVAGTYDAPDPSGKLRGIPVVFALVTSPLGARIVPSLETPGRAVTGVIHVVPTERQLRFISTYRNFEKIGLLYSSTERNSQVIAQEISGLCAVDNKIALHKTFKLDAQGRPTSEGITDMIADLRAEGAEWLYLAPDTYLGTVYDRVLPACLAQGLPTFGAAELAVRQYTALTGMISRYFSIGQLAAVKALQMLEQGSSANIPIETLRRFTIVLNINTAHALGFYPPLDLLSHMEIVRHTPSDSSST